MSIHAPHNFILQWHVTERCPWRCKHCYQESYTTPEMKLPEIFRVRDQLIELLDTFKPRPRHVQINITGGEPFARTDILKLLEGLTKYNNLWSVSLLSNGALLTKENVVAVKAMGINRLHVSMEGLEKQNDDIRGVGAFRKTIKAIELLRSAGIRVTVSLTLSKKNKNDVFALAKELSVFGVSLLAARRIVPWGHGKEMQEYLLEPRELEKFYREIANMNRWFIDRGMEIRVKGGCESGFFYDKVDFHEDTGEALMTQGTCGVRDGRILVVMPDGVVFPCRRLPIPVGKLFENTLKEIYYSPQMEAFRSEKTFAGFQACASCPNLAKCAGGALCVNYGFTGKGDIPGVQCSRAFSSLDKAAEYVNK